MDWKVEAIDKLRQYEPKRQSLRIIPLEIAQVESAMTSIRSARADSMVIRNSAGNAREDKLLNCIAKKEELQLSLDRAQMWVDSVTAALGTLNPEERKILERMYISEERGAVNSLAMELGVDKQTVYRRKDAALWKFTTALYGCVNS